MKYTLQVQLTPKLHEGNMQFYWHIDLVTEDGQFTVKHGYRPDYVSALSHAYTAGLEFVK